MLILTEKKEITCLVDLDIKETTTQQKDTEKTHQVPGEVTKRQKKFNFFGGLYLLYLYLVLLKKVKTLIVYRVSTKV